MEQDEKKGKHIDELRSLFDGALPRRRFISILGAASAGVILGGCSKDSPTEPKKEEQQPPAAPESADVAVAEIKVYDRTALKNKMADMLDKLGGLEDIIPSGGKVGMKINLTGGPSAADQWKRSTGVDASESFWTHPQIMNVMGELAIDAGAGKLYFLESYADDRVFNYYGYQQVATRLSADIINTDFVAPYQGYAKRSVGSQAFIYADLYQNGIYDELDCFISLPKVKQHVSAGITMGMKNLVGTLPQPRYSSEGSSNRWAIHSHTKYKGKNDPNTNNNLCRVILDINSATKIHLTVNDTIKTAIGGEGPWCAMQNHTFDKLILSKDVVAADTISTQIMGFNPAADDYTDTFALPSTPCINYLREAERIGLGVNDLSKITVHEV